MDQTTINRYQANNPDTGQPGDIYSAIESQHGQSAADAVAAAALSGDETQINSVLTLYTGTSTPTTAVPLADTSTADIFTNQILTDPLAAPLESANKILGNTFFSFLKNPWVLVTVALVVFFFVFDGIAILRNQAKKYTA
jgi:hypothetical protein